MAAPSINTLVLEDGAVRAKFSDTLDIDQQAHRLYLGDNWTGGVDVFDISGPEPHFLRTVRIRGSIYGVCAAPSVGKVFVGVLPSAIAVIDVSRDDGETKLIDTGGRAHTDLIDFDPVHGKLYAANRNEGFMVVLDGARDELVARIDGLGPALEQPRFNAGDGMVYLAGHGDNVLYQVDPESDTLVATLPIGVPCGPNGLAINPKTNEALLASSDRATAHTVVFDLAAREVSGVIPGCGCGDGAHYSAVADRYFFAASGYPDGPLLGIFGGAPVELLATVPTTRRASWVGFDETNGVVYLTGISEGKSALSSFALADVPGAR